MPLRCQQQTTEVSGTHQHIEDVLSQYVHVYSYVSLEDCIAY